MIFPKLKKLAALRGFKIDKDAIYGIDNGIPFAFSYSQDLAEITLRIFLGKISDTQTRAISEYVNSIAPSYYYKKYRLNESELMIFFDNKKKTTPELLGDFTDKISAKLVELGLNKQGYCMQCQKECARNNTYLQGSILYYAHDKCARKLGASPANMKTSKAKPVLMTYLAALLLGGAMVALLTMVGSGAIVMSLAIPWLLQRVFERFDPPESAHRLPWITGALLLSAIVAGWGYCIAYNAINGLLLYFSDIFGILALPQTLAWITVPFFVMVLFLFILSVFRRWRQGKKIPMPKKVTL